MSRKLGSLTKEYKTNPILIMFGVVLFLSGMIVLGVNIMFPSGLTYVIYLILGIVTMIGGVITMFGGWGKL